jgi:DNA polymerase type B, organellar and viral
MLSRKYHNYIFYTHNFGKFDVVFLLKIIEEANINNPDNKYKIDCISKDGVILRLNISIKNDKTNTKISIIDSINLLSGSLSKLGKDFGSVVTKGDFPHEFVKRNTLNYIGETPDKEYFKNIDDNKYRELYKKDWDLKSESLKYLERDLLTHLFIMDEFNRYIFINYSVQMSESLTISRLALNIYFNKYLKDSKILLIKKYDMFDFIKKGYYGGITEIYKPYAEESYYYDVNSLYPHVSKMSMPGNKCKYIEDLSGIGLNLNELFGFFYCKVKTNNGYIGLLPVHTDKGEMINPNGEYYGVWSTEELKFATENGYKIKVIKGYNFNKIENTFSDYVDDLYNKKCYPTTLTEKSISKSLLNNLTGRWGMSIIKPTTKLVNKEELDYMLTTRKVSNIKLITENKYLVTFISQPSKEICLSHNLDYEKVIRQDYKWGMESSNDFTDVSIVISAMITSYARIYMNKIKLDILNKGGQIYYMDTDSIVTNIQLPNHIVGIELGKFKLEYKIKKAYFISNKTYCLLSNEDKVIIKSKGVINDKLKILKICIIIKLTLKLLKVIQKLIIVKGM